MELEVIPLSPRGRTSHSPQTRTEQSQMQSQKRWMLSWSGAAYLLELHAVLALGPELADQQVGCECCEDREQHQAAGEKAAHAVVSGSQPGSGLGPTTAAAFLGQHFHARCFPKAQLQVCHARAVLEVLLT